ncbi:MAG: DUF3857 and transglutaminase domain-containing protein [Crocinitomicaceae bacterium]|nr:DUF3857 and transglutaminase domain-containing protein [Crocinitomicaceae bacterium]
MKKAYFSRYVVGLLLVFQLTNNLSFGQDEISYAALKQKFPDEIGVVLEHDQLVEISVNKKTGELDIYTTDREVVLYFRESAKYYTDQSITISQFFEELTDIEAKVITPAGKKLKVKEENFRMVDSAPSSWVFHDDNQNMIFELPELGEGYKSEISYTRKILRPQFFDVFHFVSGYPVMSSKVQITYPSTVKMKFFEQSMSDVNVVRTVIEGKKGHITQSWEMKDVEAHRSEDGSVNIKYYIPHLVAQIQSYVNNQDQEVKLISNVEELHTYFEGFLALMGEEKGLDDMHKLVDEITANVEDPIAKMDSIFNWVQHNIKYIAFEDGINGYVPRSYTSVIQNRYGDCKDMGNLLSEMLTYAGVENAFIAWVGTRDIPYQMSEIATPLTCNHVICVVQKPGEHPLEDKYYYLDATSSEGSYIMPPMALQGKELLIHRGKGDYELFKVPAVHADKNYIKSRINFKFTDADSLYGSGTDFYGGYERENRSYYLANLKEDDLRDYIKELALGGANRYTLKNYSFEGVTQKKEDLVINYEFSVDNLGIKDGEDIIINPILFKPRVTKYNEEDYKYTRQKDRHRTIDYGYEITIPDNYKVKHLPEDVHFKHDLFHFDGIFRVSGNTIIVNMIYQYNLLEIPVALFGDWNEFSSAINKATIQNIILEKTGNE